MQSQISGIDCHAHVTQRVQTLDPMRHSEPEIDVTASDYLALLGQHGLTHGVLTAPSFYGHDNSLLLAALRESKGFLRGVVSVDPEIDRNTLAQWHQLGVCGVRFNLIRRSQVPDFSEHRYQALFDFLKSLGWHVEIYIESERFPTVVQPIVDSNVRIVIDHFGSPTEAEGVNGSGFRAVLGALERGQTWIKLSAPYRFPTLPLKALTDQLARAGGEECLLWGSDWPWVSFAQTVNYQDCLGWLERCAPEALRRKAILTDNPRVPFRF
jgi:predicted TIM-barrel fold metal-dependent hydrolase